MTKLLYLSYMHPTLEYDDCLIFEELGFDWFSTGVYMLPRERLSYLKVSQNMTDMFHRRLPIDRDYDATRVNEYHRINRGYTSELSGLRRPHPVLTKEFVDEFDIVYSNQAKFIISNWEVIKHKPIVWRTIGSWEPHYEEQMRPLIQQGNVTPVRFSEKEKYITSANEGYHIRNYVDEDLYKDWTGGIPEVLSFQNWAHERQNFRFGKAYSKLHPRIPARLHGAEAITRYKHSRGPVSWEEQRRLYRECDAYMYIGSETFIVAYNFLEAMMTGIPVMSFGPETGGIEVSDGSMVLHEPSDFILNRINGFVSDSIDDLVMYSSVLLNDEKLAKTISENGRKTALKYFSKKLAISRWKEFFNIKYGLNLSAGIDVKKLT